MARHRVHDILGCCQEGQSPPDTVLSVQAAELSKGKAKGGASAEGAASASGLLADLALLQGASNAAEAAQRADKAEQWKPPDNQKGDGRTKLNDLLGY